MLFVTMAFGFGCKNSRENIQHILNRSGDNSSNKFISARFWKQDPLVQIINLGDFEERIDSFELKTKEKIHVYAVGEILYELPDSAKRYYLQSDNVEILFRIRNDSLQEPIIKSYQFSFADKNKYKNEGIDFKGSKIESAQYTYEIRIPWSVINVKKPSSNQNFEVDFIIGDNDDGFIQKAKLAWKRKTDTHENKAQNFGGLKLATSGTQNKDDVFLSVKATPVIDGQADDLWHSTPKIHINNLIYGYVKDRYDLYAESFSCWDDSSLYFLFNVMDSRQKYITQKKIKERGIFVDYGWIENARFEKVWEMNAKDSHHVGGALKNQGIDTTVNLDPGKYYVHYVTDESHSFGKWTDQPPQVPFYGIVLYPEKTRDN